MTHSSNLITEQSSHIGKIKGIYRNFDSVDIFYISYARTQYDIVSTDNLDYENECRKNKKEVLKEFFDKETKIYSTVTS